MKERTEIRYTRRIDVLKAGFIREMRSNGIEPGHVELSAQLMAHSQFIRALLAQYDDGAAMADGGKMRAMIVDDIRGV